jgi:ribonuclease HI
MLGSDENIERELRGLAADSERSPTVRELRAARLGGLYEHLRSAESFSELRRLGHIREAGLKGQGFEPELRRGRQALRLFAVERHDDNALIIYTDGSSLARPRRGGYAYRLVSVDPGGAEVIHDFNGPGFLGATNNEMELLACVEALKHITGRHSPVARESYDKVVIYTDSMYVHDGVPRAATVWPSVPIQGVMVRRASVMGPVGRGALG